MENILETLKRYAMNLVMLAVCLIVASPLLIAFSMAAKYIMNISDVVDINKQKKQEENKTIIQKAINIQNVHLNEQYAIVGTLRNTSEKNIKDVMMQCSFKGASGTEIGEFSYIIYEKVPAHQSISFKPLPLNIPAEKTEVGDKIVYVITTPSQVQTINCNVIDAAIE